MARRASRCIAYALASGLAVLITSCSVQPTPSSAPPCPRGDDIDAAMLRARFGETVVAGTATVQRFVPAADPAFRGYDVEIRSRILGLAEEDQFMFVLASSPVPDITGGSEVLVVGRRGARPAEIQAAGCPAIIPRQR